MAPRRMLSREGRPAATGRLPDTTATGRLDFHARPAAMSEGGRHTPLLTALPRGDVAALARAVRGLLLRQHWAAAGGMALSDERRAESHVRPAAALLDRLLARDGRPLAQARPIERRLVGTCRHFALLLTAMLRAQGVPARARGLGRFRRVAPVPGVRV